MNREEFNQQIDKLRTQWPNSYGEARLLLLWGAFKDVPAATFTDAVTECLLSSRGAPLQDELSQAVDRAKVRQNRSYGDRNAWELLQQAEKSNKYADPDYVQACMKTLKLFLSGKITRAQFDEACDGLDTLADQINPQGRNRGYGNRGGVLTITKPNTGFGAGEREAPGGD